MLIDQFTNLSLSSFTEKAHQKKVVIIYPTTAYRNVYLSYFIQQFGQHIIYYRFTREYNAMEDWFAHLAEYTAKTLPKFSSALKAHSSDIDNPALYEAMVADLHPWIEQRKGQLVVYLDEVDRLPQNETFVRFMRNVINALPDRMQLVVNSRRLSVEPWVDFVESGEAVVLGTEHRRNSLIYTPVSPRTPQIDIYAFGQGMVYVDGQPVTNWDGILPRHLFFYLADHTAVTRNNIFEAFWPDMPVKGATNVFHVTKRKIVECLSAVTLTDEDYDITLYQSGFYVANPRITRHYDVHDFEQFIAQANRTNDDEERKCILSSAIAIYRAPFLESVNVRWAVVRRERLRKTYAETLITLARLQARAQEDDVALGTFLAALREWPEREDIHREVMTLYHKLGRTDEAIALYRQLEAQLEKTLKVPPDPLTRKLYEEIDQANV